MFQFCLKSNSSSRHILWRYASFTLHILDVSENGTRSLRQILIFALSLMAAEVIKRKGLWTLSNWRTAGFVYKKVPMISVYVYWISRAKNRANVVQSVCCVWAFTVLLICLIPNKKCTTNLWCTGCFMWPFRNYINHLYCSQVYCD
jgi:hypothetical protein